MGNFYQNVTVKGPEQAEIVTLLRRSGRSAFVSPTRDGKTIIYDRGSEEATSPEELGAVASLLSDRFRCPALAAAIYDDDALLLGLFESGTAPRITTPRFGETFGPRGSARLSRSRRRAFKCGPS